MNPNKWITREYPVHRPAPHAQHRSAAAELDPIEEMQLWLRTMERIGAPASAIAEIRSWLSTQKSAGSSAPGAPAPGAPPSEEARSMRRARLGLGAPHDGTVRRDGNRLVFGSMTREQAIAHRERGTR